MTVQSRAVFCCQSAPSAPFLAEPLAQNRISRHPSSSRSPHVLNNRFLTVSDSHCVAALLSLYYAEAVSRLTYAQRSPSPSRLISPPSPSPLHLPPVYLSSADCAGVPPSPAASDLIYTPAEEARGSARSPMTHARRRSALFNEPQRKDGKRNIKEI